MSARRFRGLLERLRPSGVDGKRVELDPPLAGHPIACVTTSLAPPGSPTVDVLVLAPDESVIATLQVKTRTFGRDQGWHMKQKHETIIQPRCFYAFVDLEPEAPVTCIVPRSIVADVLRKSHAAWLAAPGARGQQHRDHDMRRIIPAYSFPVADYTPGWMDQYRDARHMLQEAVGDPPGWGPTGGGCTIVVSLPKTSTKSSTVAEVMRSEARW